MSDAREGMNSVCSARMIDVMGGGRGEERAKIKKGDEGDENQTFVVI